jgi:hypothetical protein
VNKMANKNCPYLQVKTDEHYCELTEDYCVAAIGETYRDGPWFRERTYLDPEIIGRCPAKDLSKGLAQKVREELVQIGIEQLRKESAKEEKRLRARLGK